jgi:hypothetical protein
MHAVHKLYLFRQIGTAVAHLSTTGTDISTVKINQRTGKNLKAGRYLQNKYVEQINT